MPKQGRFVDNLVNYNSGQWVEFFRMTPTTAQKLVEEIGPFFCQHDGESIRHEISVVLSVYKCRQVDHVLLTGRGRNAVHLQDQILMLLHFVAHRGKYGLLSDRFGMTHSCYHRCVDELLDIVVHEALHKFICWPDSHRQKETADFFHAKSGFPGVIGSIDGTHIMMSHPPPPRGRVFEIYGPPPPSPSEELLKSF